MRTLGRPAAGFQSRRSRRATVATFRVLHGLNCQQGKELRDGLLSVCTTGAEMQRHLGEDAGMATDLGVVEPVRKTRRIQTRLRIPADVRQLNGKQGSVSKECNPVSELGIVDSINAHCGSFSHSSALTRAKPRRLRWQDMTASRRGKAIQMPPTGIRTITRHTAYESQSVWDKCRPGGGRR